jgi:hypothetical protein
MKESLKTFSVAAFAALVVMGSFAFAVPSSSSQVLTYEYKQFSTIESVVPGGLGRSRILTTDDGGQVIEKELKNFYSMVGINFGNIANNDRAIVDRLNEYSVQGWELVQVSTGSQEQVSNGSSSGGLFISRYLFRRAK